MMASTRTSSLMLALLLAGAPGCGTDSGGDPGSADSGVPDNNPNNPVPACLQGLAEQCPPGSRPIVEASATQACEGQVDGELRDGEGSVTGVCRTGARCTVICNFTVPCRCGVDRIDDTGVYCVDCSTAGACGNAQCEGGENVESCPIDCAERCEPDTERCNGSGRQECSETGLWEDVACRPDQTCEFGAGAAGIATVCQTRIAPSGGSYPGLGTLGVEVSTEATDIRFVETNLSISCDCAPKRFVSDGARVVAVRNQSVVIVDPSGTEPDAETSIEIDGAAWSPALVAVHARWPQVGNFLDDTDRTLDALVHDGAYVELPGRRAVAIDRRSRVVAASFSLGYIADTRLPTVAIWDAATGEIDALLRFADPGLSAGVSPGNALAFSPSGKLLAEGRQGGTIILWNVDEGREIRIIETELGSVQDLDFANRGADELLVVAGHEQMSLWRLASGGAFEPERLWIASHGANSVALAPDGSAIAAERDRERDTLLIDTVDGGDLRTFDTTGPVHFDPRGGRLLAGGTIYSSTL